LADSSQLGCEVVQEYQANPIADDEKKMYRAQMRAERKAFHGKKRQRYEHYPKKASVAIHMETIRHQTMGNRAGVMTVGKRVIGAETVLRETTKR
jgi:hypothetical protein